MSRRHWIVLAFVVAAALTYLVSRPGDEKRIRWQVAALGEAVGIDAAERDPRARPVRIQRTFQRILTPRVEVDVADLVEDAHGREELACMATSAAETFRDLTVALDDVRVEIDPTSEHARVTTIATLAGIDRDGHPARESRDVTLRFEKADGEWRIAALTAGGAEPPGQ